MTWRDRLRTASFRGVAFFVEEHQAEGGRRVAVHDYPLKDRSDSEDMGGRTGQYQVNAYVLGTADLPNYMDGRDALLKALRTPGAGSLIHPYLGELEVKVEHWRLSESTRYGGMARFDLDLLDSADVQQPSATADTQLAVADQATLALSASDTQFSDAYAIDNDGQRLDAEASLTDALDEIEGALGQASVDADLVQAIAAEPAAIAARIDADILRLTSLAQLRLLYGYRYAPPGGNPSAQANRDALATAVRTAATIAAVQVSAATTFASYDDAIAVRDELLDQLDAVALQAQPELYVELVALRKAMVDDITTRAADLARLATFTPAVTRPALAIAYRLYGAVDVEASAEDLATRNGVEHPGFVPGRVPLQVLTDWRPGT